MDGTVQAPSKIFMWRYAGDILVCQSSDVRHTHLPTLSPVSKHCPLLPGRVVSGAYRFNTKKYSCPKNCPASSFASAFS